MAEIAIPIAALGVMYILSNKDKNKTVETFETSRSTPSKIPNTSTPVVNYPIETYNELKDNPSHYREPNNLKQRYYDPKVHKAMANEESQEMNNEKFVDLVGREIDKSNLKHANMQPFFGSNVTQTSGVGDKRESFLDCMVGSGSQQNKKEARAPLFKPQPNLSYTHGAPDQGDFMRSRINAPMRVANINPFEEKRVGPGMDKGFSAEGVGGFNSGMEARNVWQPKTVDDLRVKTNPKETYSLDNHKGPAISKINNRGIHGRVEKSRPDTYFLNTPDRWLTTTGAEKAGRVVSEEPMQYQNRPFTTREHFGNADVHVTSGEAPTHRGNYRESTKEEAECGPIGAAKCNESGPNRMGYKVYPNSRSTTQHEVDMGPVQRGLWAVVSPVMDILRPTRKENVVGAARKVGNAGTHNGNRGVIWNPSDRTPTTIREQTSKTKHTTQPSRASNGGGYETNKQYAPQTQKQSMHCSYTSNARSNIQKPTTYNSAYNAQLNPNREVICKSRLNHGNTNTFNSSQNVKTTKIGIKHQAQMFPSMPSNIQNISNMGEISGRNTREVSQLNRNNSALLSAYNNNPYTKSLNSWA
jgi:hypothetical protein